MRIDLGAAIFQESANILKIGEHHMTIAGQRSIRRGCQISADLRGVLVQREDGKDVAEDHPGQNQADPAQEQQSPRAHRCKPCQFGFPSYGRIYECLRSGHVNLS